MIVDRRKDSYDELMMLSRDSRLDRNRKSKWTTWIVASTVLASGVYVGGTNEQLGDLAEAKNAAENQRDNLRKEFSSLLDERNALVNEREFYKKSNEWLIELAKSSGLSSETKDVVNNFAGPGTGVPTEIQPLPTSANIVWVVEGSRRFPMKNNDILWIPEARFWVSVEIDRSATPNTRAFIQYGERPSSQDKGTEVPSGHIEKSPHNASSCVQLTMHDSTIRAGFGGNYIDMEVLYLPAGASCQ